MLYIKRLLLIAAVVRGVYLAAAVLTARWIDDYDTSSVLLSESCSDTWPEVVAQVQQQYSLVVWDSVFLHRISACGYEFEQYFAFFPGLPGLIWSLRSTGLFKGPYGFSSITLLFNNSLFLLSVALLARLSQQLLQDDVLATVSTLIFIMSPASIHHSMLYTEALFTASSWLGLYCLYCKGWSVPASLVFAVSSATRSNGLLNAGFLLHEHGRRFLLVYKDNRVTAAHEVVQAAGCTAIAVAPYIAYMMFGYQAFCTGAYGDDRQRPWCSRTIPSAYGYVQDVYWDVGFLRYYTVQQIPNFLLASPTLIISIWGALAYACANPHHSLTGGLLSQHQLRHLVIMISTKSRLPCVLGHSIKGGISGKSDDLNNGMNSNNKQSTIACSSVLTGCSTPKLLEAVAVGYTQCHAIKGQPDRDAGMELRRDAGQQQQQQQVAEASIYPGAACIQSPERRNVKQLVPVAAGNSEQQQQWQQQDAQGAQCSRSQRGEGLPARCTCATGAGYYSQGVAVFVIHWAVLTLVCLAVVHIQVATRFLSSCAPLYWFAALLMVHKGTVLQWLLWWYCFAFMGVGAAFFVNFYPWT